VIVGNFTHDLTISKAEFQIRTHGRREGFEPQITEVKISQIKNVPTSGTFVPLLLNGWGGGIRPAWRKKNTFAYRHFRAQPKNQGRGMPTGHARSNPTSLSRLKKPDTWSDFLSLAGDRGRIPNFLQGYRKMSNIPEESYLELKKILEKQNHTTYTLEEIKEIGDGLLDFYELLAELDAERTGMNTSRM
jgi:hypothetical protein